MQLDKLHQVRADTVGKNWKEKEKVGQPRFGINDGYRENYDPQFPRYTPFNVDRRKIMDNITSTKIRKERSLFNAVQRLNAFVKNAVAFLKLF